MRNSNRQTRTRTTAMRHLFAAVLGVGVLFCAAQAPADYIERGRERTETKIAHLDRTAALLDRLEEAGPEAVAKELTVQDLESLLYSRESVLGEAVLRYCTLRFGEDLQGYSRDMQAFFKAMQYLEAIHCRPCAEPFARAVGQMGRKSSYGLIKAVCSVLKSVSFRYEDGDPRDKILTQLFADFERNGHHRAGPGWGLAAMGDEDTVMTLIDVMVRPSRMNPPHVIPARKTDVLSVINRLMKPTYKKALERLADVIRGATYRNSILAIEIVKPFASRDVDAALEATATNTDVPQSIRAQSIRAIGERKMVRLCDTIETIGKEEDLHQAVAKALKHIGDRNSLPLLASYLDDPKMVRIYAAESIGVIIGKPFSLDDASVAAAREWWNKHSEDLAQPE